MSRWRSLVTVVAVTAAVGAATVAVPGAAWADPPVTPGASAFSAGATTGSAALQANLQLSGSLGGLLDVLISPIVTQALDPLVAALQGSLNTTVASLLGASSSLHADTPVTQSGSLPAAFPNDTAPSPCPSPGPVPCYQASGENVNAAPLVSLGLGAITGWTQQVPSSLDATVPIYGRAQVASATVSALTGITSLTNPLVSTGAVNAKANCPNDGKSGATKPQTAPSALVQDAGITLLGGQVTFDVLDGQIADLVVGGTSYSTLQSLGSVPLSSGITVSSYGNAVVVSIPIAAADLLGAIGLSNSVVTQLLGYSPTSTVTLSVIVGPSAQPTVNTASAYGLQIGVDLSGSLGFNLLGLVGATVNLPSGISSSNSGNLLDVRLATVTCASGNGISAVNAAIPPALV